MLTLDWRYVLQVELPDKPTDHTDMNLGSNHLESHCLLFIVSDESQLRYKEIGPVHITNT